MKLGSPALEKINNITKKLMRNMTKISILINTPVILADQLPWNLRNGEPTLLAHCLYYMSPLNYKRTTSSLAPPIICVAKKLAIKR